MKTLYIIGGGGVGSWLVPSLRLLERRCRIMVLDGDILEPKNLNRQLFTEADIGRNKAEALAEKYQCEFMSQWFSAGLLEPGHTDWLIVCVDNHAARSEALTVCDIAGCRAILGANETHSSEAFVYLPEWKGGAQDPRIYYPQITTDLSGDPRRAAIGCTGEARTRTPQLVSANFMAAALMQHLYVLWGIELPRMEDRFSLESRMPYKLNANLAQLETHRPERNHADSN